MLGGIFGGDQIMRPSDCRQNRGGGERALDGVGQGYGDGAV
tara:strand:+ start:517 stop:639 length:123 start_codon:yes stop_codon:yes gene_type:complete